MSETILVTGATGTLGRFAVPGLRERGYDVRAMSRRPRTDTSAGWLVADLATGDGLDAAVAGAHTVVHLASAPYRGRYTATVDIAGTRRLVAAAARAGVRHLVYLSIVGVDRVPWGYYRIKLAAEEAVRAGGVPWTVLRATQFPQLLDQMLGTLSRLGVLPVDRGIVAQPVHPVDVTGRIAELVDAGPSNATHEYGGPQVLGFDESLRPWQRARGSRRPVLPIRIPGRLGRTFRDGALTTTAQPTGTLTWADYLAQAYPPPDRR